MKNRTDTGTLGNHYKKSKVTFVNIVNAQKPKTLKKINKIEKLNNIKFDNFELLDNNTPQNPK